MKRKTKVIIIIGILLACVSLGVWYINKFVLPVKIRVLVVNLLKEKTGYDVTIGRINYLPLSQFYLKDITFYDREVPREPLANIKRLSFSFRVWPLLKEKSIVARLGLKDLSYGPTRLNGVASLFLKRRPLPAPRPFLKNLDGVIKLVNFSLAIDALPSNLESITGTISFEDNLIRLSQAFFNYKNYIYNLEGILTDLDKDEPQGSLSLNSEILTSEGRFIVKDDYIQIKEIVGTLFDSSYNIMGDIKGLPAPFFNLYGEAKVDLADLKKLFPDSKYVSDSLKPAGLCDAALFFNGGLNNFAASEGSIKLRSNKVFLHGLALDDLYLDLRMKEGLVNTSSFTLRPYLGLFNGSFNLDLRKEGLPYSTSFVLKDANLAKFSSDMSFGKEDITGFISSKCFLKGNLTSIDTLRGSGWIAVRDGHLWEWPFLSGVAGLLRLPDLKAEVFKEAAGNFIVDQRRISTEDLTFYSDRVNMSARGFADFDGNLDFILTTNITQDLVKGSSDATRIANLLISQAGNYMGRIKITGTCKDPKFKFAAKPIDEVFKKEIKEIKGLLKDIIR